MALLRGIGSFISTVVGLFFMALLVALIVGPHLYLELAGQRTSMQISAKHELIEPLTEAWSRRLTVAVIPPTGEAPANNLEVGVDAATYDRLSVGSLVDVRRVDIPLPEGLPSVPVVRLDSQLPFGSLFARLGDRGGWMIVGVIVFLGLLAIAAKLRRTWIGFMAFALALGGGMVTGSGWLPAPTGPLADGQAEVRAVKRIDRVWGGRRTPAEDAVQPFVLVELVFVPEGRRDPVVAVDAVDDGSVPGLVKDGTVPIRYSAGDPRWAQIDGGSRTYFWKNLRTYGVLALGLLAIAGFGWLRWRGKQQKPAGQP